MMQHKQIAVYIAAGTMLLAGCSSVPPPHAQIATAEFAIQNAQQTSAPENAALDLRLAREKLEKAKSAMDSEDYLQARRLAEEAQVDAQLAASKARSEDAMKTAQQLREAIQSLRQEATRAGG